MGATEVDGHSFKDIGLPEFTVISRKESETGDILYTVEPKERIAACLACGGKLHIHKDAKRKVKDLDEFGHRVGIVVKGKSYRCKDCGETVREEYASICGQMTRRMVESIQRDVFGDMTFTQIARRYNVSVSTVQGLFEEQGEKLWTAYHFVTPRVLGIDEVHLNNAYYGVFVNVDRQNGGIIELSEERSKNAVIDVLKRLENPENLCYVTMDMWRPYYDAVQSVFPGIPVIIDHFHVIKELSRSLDSIRAGLCKSIKDTKTRVSLKHNRFLLLKSSEELTPTQKRALDVLLAAYPQFDIPYQLKESFRNIYAFAKTKSEALKMFDEWCVECEQLGITAYNGFITMIRNWEPQIFAYFDFTGDDRTNAQTESLNRAIRNVARDGRGYSFQNLRTKMVFYKKPTGSTRFNFDAFDD